MIRRTPIKRSNKPIKRTPLKRGGRIKVKKKTEEKILYEKLENEKMKKFFLMCWNTLPRQSEIGPAYEKFYGEPKTYYFHHCFEKSNCPELKYSISNILRVTGDEHACLNGNIEYFPEARKKREYIIENWDKLIEESKLFEEMFEKSKNNV